MSEQGGSAYAEQLLRYLNLSAPGYASSAIPDEESLDLSQGELRVPIPARLLAAGFQGLSRDLGYQDPRGHSDLRGQYLSLVGAQARLDTTSVLVTAGAKQALWIAILLSARPGEKIAVPRPGWSPYVVWAKAAGMEPVFYDPASPEVVATILALLRQGATTLILNYPNNPTGADLDGTARDQILAGAAQVGATIISDEVYREFGGRSFSFVDYAGECGGASVIVADSISKWVAAAGLRVGFLLGSREFIGRALSIRSLVDSCPSVASQWLAMPLLSEEACAFRNSLRELAGTRVSALAQLIRDAGGIVASEGAIYVWARADEHSQRIRLRDLTLAGAPGELFGEAGMVRLCPVSIDIPAVRQARLMES